MTQRFDGKVVSPQPADRLIVEAIASSGHLLQDRTHVQRDGSFQLSAAPGATYEIRVLNERGEKIYSDLQNLRNGQQIELRLPSSLFPRQQAGGGISAVRLQHKPAKHLMKLARKADNLAADGDIRGSVAQLEEVVRRDPQWFEVWNNLGSRKLSLGDFPGAADAFRKALEIDRNSAGAHSNLGLALLFLQQPEQAESEARKALKLEPEHPRASYVVGLALFQQNRNTTQALEYLDRSTPAIPRVHLSIAEWHCRHQEYDACATRIRTFLKTPASPFHDKARQWLATLKKQRLLR